MIYIPNTYNSDAVDKNFDNLEEFVYLQKKYKKTLEEYLDKKVNLRNVEMEILNSNLQIPQVQDQDYNFYHQSDVLKSGYLFVRNNIHIEKLSEEELKYLKEAPQLDEQFIINTFQRVLFEEGYFTFFGPAIPENKVLCSSVIIEFAYNMSLCETTDQYFSIKDLIDTIFEKLQINFQKEQIPLSCLVYNQIPDYFLEDKKKLAR